MNPMTDETAFLHEVETRLGEWDAKLDTLEEEARRAVAEGTNGAEEEIQILQELRRKHQEMRIRIHALRIVKDGGWQALQSETEELLQAIDATFARSTLLRAPD
jgi:hypothetical protein